VRYLIVDECDAMQNSSEGDTIALAEKKNSLFREQKSCYWLDAIRRGDEPRHPRL
jgi:hypothetical protein